MEDLPAEGGEGEEGKRGAGTEEEGFYPGPQRAGITATVQMGWAQNCHDRLHAPAGEPHAPALGADPITT